MLQELAKRDLMLQKEINGLKARIARQRQADAKLAAYRADVQGREYFKKLADSVAVMEKAVLLPEQGMKNAPAPGHAAVATLNSLNVLKQQNDQMEVRIRQMEDSISMYENRVKNADKVKKQNDRLKKDIVSKYNRDVEALLSGEGVDDRKARGLDQEKHQLALLGIDTARLKSTKQAADYINLDKALNAALSGPYNKQEAQRLLALPAAGNVAQRQKLEDKKALLEKYCAATDRCFEVLDKIKSYGGATSLSAAATEKLQSLDHEIAAGYIYLKQEIQRLLKNTGKTNGLKDHKFRSCH